MQYCPDTSCPYCGNLGLIVTETAPTGDSYFCEKCGQEHTETPHERQERRAPASLEELAVAVNAVEAITKAIEGAKEADDFDKEFALLLAQEAAQNAVLDGAPVAEAGE